MREMYFDLGAIGAEISSLSRVKGPVIYATPRGGVFHN